MNLDDNWGNCWVILKAFGGLLQSNPQRVTDPGPVIYKPLCLIPLAVLRNFQDMNSLVTYRRIAFEYRGEVEELASGTYAKVYELMEDQFK